MDNNDSLVDSRTDTEKEIEDIVDDVCENTKQKLFNFLINASNQANITDTHKGSYSQLNAIFVLVHPYNMQDFNVEDLDLEIRVDKDDLIYINDQKFKSIEIKPGIKVFALSKDD